jgi:hypothetical protein
MDQVLVTAAALVQWLISPSKCTLRCPQGSANPTSVSFPAPPRPCPCRRGHWRHALRRTARGAGSVRRQPMLDCTCSAPSTIQVVVGHFVARCPREIAPQQRPPLPRTHVRRRRTRPSTRTSRHIFRSDFRACMPSGRSNTVYEGILCTVFCCLVHALR